MRGPVLILICLFMFAAAAWFRSPPPVPDYTDVSDAGIVTGVVMFLAGMGAWFVLLGFTAGRERG